MSVSAAFREQVVELFAPLGPVQLKGMFGGIGVYADGLMFGLGTSDDTLYLKTDEITQPQFVDAGSKPFVYSRDGKDMPMSYWRLPDEAWDDPDEALRWGRLAIEAARRKAAGKPRPRAAGAAKPKPKSLKA